jgi:hypothetical protein
MDFSDPNTVNAWMHIQTKYNGDTGQSQHCKFLFYKLDLSSGFYQVKLRQERGKERTVIFHTSWELQVQLHGDGLGHGTNTFQSLTGSTDLQGIPYLMVQNSMLEYNGKYLCVANMKPLSQNANLCYTVQNIWDTSHLRALCCLIQGKFKPLKITLDQYQSGKPNHYWDGLDFTIRT